MSTPQPQASGAGAGMAAYVQLVRLPNVFTAMADVLMGFLFTHAVFAAGDGLLAGLLLAASGCFYGGGVVLNDLFDLETDARERPQRPLPSGRISVAAAGRLGWGLLAFGLVLAGLAALLAGDRRPGVVAAVLAAWIVVYDGWLKRTWLGPLAMGGCRMLNVLLGMSTAAGVWQDEHWLVAAAIGTYIVGVSWFARREAGRSNRRELVLATGVMLCGIGLLGFLPGRTDSLRPILQQEPGRWVLLVLVVALLVGYRCIWAAVEPTACRVQAAVKLCILSVVVLDAWACLAVRGMPGALAVLGLLVPAVVAGWWIEST